MPASNRGRPYAGTGGRPIPQPVLSCSTRQKRAGQPWRHHDACQGGMPAAAAPGESLIGTALGLQPPKNPAHRVGAGKKRPKFEAPRPIPAWPCPRPWPYPRRARRRRARLYAAGVHTGNRKAGRALQITASKAITASPIEMSRYAPGSIAAARWRRQPRCACQPRKTSKVATAIVVAVRLIRRTASAAAKGAGRAQKTFARIEHKKMCGPNRRTGQHEAQPFDRSGAVAGCAHATSRGKPCTSSSPNNPCPTL